MAKGTELTPAEFISKHISYWIPMGLVYTVGEIIMPIKDHLKGNCENGDVVILSKEDRYRVVYVTAEPGEDNQIKVKYWLRNTKPKSKVFFIEDTTTSRNARISIANSSVLRSNRYQSERFVAVHRSDAMKSEMTHQKSKSVEIGSIYEIYKTCSLRHKSYQSYKGIVTNKGIIRHHLFGDILHLEFSIIDKKHRGIICFGFTGEFSRASEYKSFGSPLTASADTVHIVPIEVSPRKEPVAYID